MRYRIISLSFLIVFILGSFSHAFSGEGEGMWLPLLIKKKHEGKMQAKGMKLDAEDIYDINNSSIKDAIIRLNGGMCTAEIVSDQGLLFTNHHCAYDLISKLSTTKHNYLKNGFWASSLDEELKTENFTASRLVRMAKVTDAILPVIDTLKGTAKSRKKSQLIDSIKNAATKGNHYNAQVKSMYHGNEYYLMVYETFKDIRLVGAPPSDIGKFGGDTDNWMWPRHTGDFAVLRIYAGPNGKPADYSEDNVPYKAKYSLPLSLKGYKEGTFTMIMGYPGNTDRYLSSYAVKHKMQKEEPTIIDVFDVLLTNMKQKMEQSEEAKLKLASDYASISNYHKYYKGQLKGLREYDLVAKKKAKEEKFMEWVNKKKERKEKYGDVLNNLKETYNQFGQITPGFYYFPYGLFQLELINHAYRFNNFYRQLKSLEMTGSSGAEIDSAVADFKGQAQDFFSNNYMEMEKESLKELLTMYAKNVPAKQRPDFINNLIESHPGQSVEKTVEQYLTDMYRLPPAKRQDLLGYGIRSYKLAQKISNINNSAKADSLANMLKSDILAFHRHHDISKAKEELNDLILHLATSTKSKNWPRFLQTWLAKVNGKDTAAIIAKKMKDIYNKGFLFDNKTFLVDSMKVKEVLSDVDPKALKEDPLVKITKQLQGYDQLRKGSIVLDSAKAMQFLANPEPWKLENEPFLQFGTQLLNFYRSHYIMTYRQVQNELDDYMKVFMQGLREWKEDKTFYPNANSTMRLSYGMVEPYVPRDAVFYNYYTTHKGILQKRDPDDKEFDVPDKLLKLIKNKNFGRYGTHGGDTLQVCFITDNDITGGNSGSPVINGKGHQIGIAFDGNWESMIGDLVIDESVNRTISVDIRYVLFVIDKFANSDHIMEELEIVGIEEKKQDGES